MSVVTRLLRRSSAWALLIALSGVMVLTLTQCQLVNDLLGVDLRAQNANKCIAACSKAYNDSVRVESEFHVDLIHACGTDSVCIALEDVRYLAAVDRIQLGRQNCQNNCHHQGGGEGGQ
jgi:hypothetical protein